MNWDSNRSQVLGNTEFCFYQRNLALHIIITTTTTIFNWKSDGDIVF
jgi:hypothetical protein